jgi:hypothetical protein
MDNKLAAAKKMIFCFGNLTKKNPEQKIYDDLVARFESIKKYKKNFIPRTRICDASYIIDLYKIVRQRIGKVSDLVSLHRGLGQVANSLDLKKIKTEDIVTKDYIDLDDPNVLKNIDRYSNPISQNQKNIYPHTLIKFKDELFDTGDRITPINIKNNKVSVNTTNLKKTKSEINTYLENKIKENRLVNPKLSVIIDEIVLHNDKFQQDNQIKRNWNEIFFRFSEVIDGIKNESPEFYSDFSEMDKSLQMYFIQKIKSRDLFSEWPLQRTMEVVSALQSEYSKDDFKQFGELSQDAIQKIRGDNDVNLE